MSTGWADDYVAPDEVEVETFMDRVDLRWLERVHDPRRLRRARRISVASVSGAVVCLAGAALLADVRVALAPSLAVVGLVLLVVGLTGVFTAVVLGGRTTLHRIELYANAAVLDGTPLTLRGERPHSHPVEVIQGVACHLPRHELEARERGRPIDDRFGVDLILVGVAVPLARNLSRANTLRLIDALDQHWPGESRPPLGGDDTDLRALQSMRGEWGQTPRG